MGKSDKKEIERLERDLEKQKRKNNIEHTIFLLVMSCIYIAVGTFLTFVRQAKMIYLCYILCAGLIIYGIIQIVRYFVKERYKKFHDYSFSFGVLLVVLGSCALARSEEVAANITLYLGLCILITSIVMLQNAIQLKTLGSNLWPAVLGVSCTAIVCAVLIIADMEFMASIMMTFTCWVLMIGGAVSVASLMIVYFSIQKYIRQGDLRSTDADAADPGNGTWESAEKSEATEEWEKDRETKTEETKTEENVMREGVSEPNSRSESAQNKDTL